MRFLISAGEASGELYGAQLIQALRQRMPTAEFFGIGGERMRAAGCDTVVDSSRLAVVGISEIVSHLPRIYGDFRKLIRAAEERRPDAAVVIDSPAFNFRVAREMHRRGVPVIYYVCPQLWAWRERRVERFHKWVKKALVIFPFEEAWYRERGVDAEYVGHPLADRPPLEANRKRYGAEHGLDPSQVWIGLLPGSRKKEVLMNLPALLEAAGRMQDRLQFLLPVASTLDRDWMQGLMPAGGTHIRLVGQAWSVLPHLRAAAVASGTATVEAALAGTPMVVVYRVSPLTWKLGRGLLRVPFIAMPNLIAGREVVPELVQADFTAGAVASRLEQIIPEGPAREKMLAGLAAVAGRLRDTGSAGTSSERAADAVLRTVA